MALLAGCTLSHRGAVLELDKYCEVDTWEGHGQQGEILSGTEEFKNTKKKFLATILRGEVLAQISFPEKQESSLELAPDLLFEDLKIRAI